MKKIFISGPYTKGDVAQNVKKSMDLADELINMGYAPYCPHLTHFLHMNKFQEYEKWLSLDMVYLKCCDAVIRIPGESSGADKEVEAAIELGMPVFYTLDDLLSFKGWNKNH